MTVTELYGGAIVTELPEGFVDVSEFREVPDDEEVFVLEGNGYPISLIFDLLELEHIEDLKKAHTNIIDDIMDFNGLNSTEYKILKEETYENDASYPVIVYTTAVSGSHAGPKKAPSGFENQPYIGVIATVRLHQGQTDMAITLNCPISEADGASTVEQMLSQDSPATIPLIQTCEAMMKQIVQKLHVRDWTLFA
ncbi:hypothetical protein CANCADRAFT_30422 [Tortispora caseinolytica NRRL Y-17796]|uniref:Mog1p/PsbP-like protein n=1 Tax=Tortispora caseinolytica NRRL Y-17796 TaxID=767744 RepID=A0A1E4TKB0_9ASCO|nr:hypothetical protein CANCADRAFT_30422 [Tortispora caseinolytica NRRL Y-17796]